MKKIIALMSVFAIVLALGMNTVAAPAVDKTNTTYDEYEEGYEPAAENISCSIVGRDDILVSIDEITFDEMFDEAKAKLAALVPEGQKARVFDIIVGDSVHVIDGQVVVDASMDATTLARESRGQFEVAFIFDDVAQVVEVYVYDGGNWVIIDKDDWWIENGRIILKTADNGDFAFVIDPNKDDIKFRISSQPQNYKGVAGSIATFNVKAEGTGLKYQWQTFNSGKWTSIPGETSNTLSVVINKGRNGQMFRCLITDKLNRRIISNEVILFVDTSSLNILTQPVDYTGPVGSTAVFSVSAQGTGIKYQWQTYTSGAWKNSSFTGSTTSKLSVPITAARDGYQFRCIILDGTGNNVVSNTAVLHVAPSVSITSQPKDITGAVGSTATFKVKATGTGLKYQWQAYSNGAWKNSSLTGAKTATLSVPVTQARNGYKFRCIVTDAYNNKVTSKAVTLHVSVSVTLSITTQPKSYTGPVGSTATFKVKATGTGLKYQWQTYSNGSWKSSSLTGAKTATLSVPVTLARNGYKFRCVITDASGNKVTSKTVTITVG